MSTFMAKESELNRKWYIIDAAGKPLGRVAVAAASILRGKHKPEYTPHVDTGDFVIIINAKEAALTGNKFEDKKYYRHTGYIGNLKETAYKDMLVKHPTRAMELAVWGMLPHNSLGRKMYGKLKVYADANHKQQAQSPELWTREI